MAEGRTATRRSGVTVAICCFNSSTRLPETLRHLSVQQVSADVAWEVLLIDNASTDGTSAVAREAWPADARTPLRIVPEPRPGLSHARERARLEAHYEYISFIDDDNWVSPTWVATVKAVLDAHPEVSSCGGPIEAVFERPVPDWFDGARQYLAVGEQASARGPMGSYLWGAGLSIRLHAWDALREAGFVQWLSDRTGKDLVGGGDLELCAGLRLAGWQQWYEPDLRLRHFMPESRLRWRYVCRLLRGAGVMSVLLLPYDAAIRGEPLTIVQRLRQSWPWLMQAAVRDLLVHWRAALPSQRAIEGHEQALAAEWRIGRFLGLLRCGWRYRRVRTAVRHAPWRQHLTGRTGVPCP